MANDVIDQGLVKVDDQVETRRRNKIKPGMKVEYNGQSVVVS
jgi:ribosome-associated protein YbcJ (S4-like RNA binding protein)